VALLPFDFPADSFTPGAYLAHDARFPAVGNRVMSTPISAMIDKPTDVDNGVGDQPWQHWQGGQLFCESGQAAHLLPGRSNMLRGVGFWSLL